MAHNIIRTLRNILKLNTRKSVNMETSMGTSAQSNKANNENTNNKADKEDAVLDSSNEQSCSHNKKVKLNDKQEKPSVSSYKNGNGSVANTSKEGILTDDNDSEYTDTDEEEAVEWTNMKIKPPEKSLSLTQGTAIEKLHELGYAFNNKGELRKINAKTGEASNEPYEFEVSKNKAQNQEHYEKLAEQIPEIVYDLLEQEGLTRMYLPEEVSRDSATFIFTKPAKLQKSKKLLVLIHGSGFVRAGQWARSLIINNSLNHGTQIPYIRTAVELGYDIVVTNTNDNYRIIKGKKQPIPDMGSAVAHAMYVWDRVIVPSEAESVAIVAHSFGGMVTAELAKNFPTFFSQKVFAIAFTDSAHFGIPTKVEKSLSDITCNWVASNESLDTQFKRENGRIRKVSAGHTKHEWTSYTAMESVFKFIEYRYQLRKKAMDICEAVVERVTPDEQSTI